MIKLMFSRRHKRKVYRLDATVNGKRFRRFFLKKADAEAVAYKIKHDTIAKRYGLPVMAERPLLSDLVEKRLKAIHPAAERTRSALHCSCWLTTSKRLATRSESNGRSAITGSP